ncbi:hypothetical protein MUP46_01485 [Patescibacteria group bacterium]|nr:hypothetical protein [Patescibacteria group bacterium]
MVDIDRLRTLPGEELVRLALKGEVILASEEGIGILDGQIDRTKNEAASLKLRLGEVARQDPDLPENIEFKEIKTKLQFEIPRKLDDLGRKKAKTIVFQENQDGAIRFGTLFEARIEYPTETTSGVFVFLGPIEAAAGKIEAKPEAQVISYLSVVGKALWGYDPNSGKPVQFETPAGKATCIVKKVFKP